MMSDKQINGDMQPEMVEFSEASKGRRKLIRGGVIGVPVLLALKSAPVLACNCKMPSGFSVSGNLSQTAKNSCEFPAKSPSQIASNDPLRNKKFAGNVNQGNAGLTLPYGKTNAYTLGNALTDGGDGALVAAAYINANNNHFSPGVTKEIVRTMWNNTVSGTYTATTGVNWTRDDVIAYLKYVMAMS